MLLLYLFVRNAAAENRVGPALNAAVMTIGITIVAFSLFVADLGALEPVGWALEPVGWALFAAALLTVLVRTKWPLLILGLLMIAAAAGAAAYVSREDLSFVTLRPFLLAGVFLLLMSFLRWPPIKTVKLRFGPLRRIRLWWRSRRRLDPVLSAEVNDVADTYLANKMAELEPEQFRKLSKQVRRRLSRLV